MATTMTTAVETVENQVVIAEAYHQFPIQQLSDPNLQKNPDHDSQNPNDDDSEVTAE